MSGPHFASLNREQVDAFADACRRAGAPHLVPIAETLKLGVGIVIACQDTGPFRLPKKRKPTLALIGDDMEAARGPQAFHLPSLRRLLRSAGGVSVVSSGPETGVYAISAAQAALLRRDVVIIETRIEQEIPWLEFVRKTAPKLPVLLSTVKGGTA